MDAITVFLQGHLSEEIYMEQPDGFNDGSGRVCRLKKVIYELKQSGREWKRLKNTLKSFGNKKLSYGCVFLRILQSRSNIRNLRKRYYYFLEGCQIER